MGASFVPIVVFTVLWGVVGIVCPFFAPKGPNRGIIQVVLILTAATCWLFWLCAYMAQMNPSSGPDSPTKLSSGFNTPGATPSTKLRPRPLGGLRRS